MPAVVPDATGIPVPANARRLLSRIDPDGLMELSLVTGPVVTPGDGEVLIAIEAAPVNPADIRALLCGLAPADLTYTPDGSGYRVSGRLTAAQLEGQAGRIGQPLPLGNEGCGIVIAAGQDAASRGMLGRRVAVAAGCLYASHSLVPTADCIVLPDACSPEKAAAAWINPLTALAMVETMKRDGHGGLVLTAAASSLGQILGRLCRHDGIPLVAIVRSEEGRDLLREQGAEWVCNSSAPAFAEQLTEALTATGATLAFDATGGGTLAGTILATMEKVLVAAGGGYSRYGSPRLKQLYFFGGLDPAPVSYARRFGMAWTMGGWLLQSALATFPEATVTAMKQRIADQLDAIFVTPFDRKIAFDALLAPGQLAICARHGTGMKHLLTF